MDPKFFRKYADLITEAEQLDEGMTDKVVQVAKAAVNKIAPSILKQVTDLVSSALGKPANQLSMADLTMANANKVLAANKQLAEADQNLHYSNNDYGQEYADIPGTTDRLDKAKAGGILGSLFGVAAAAGLSVPGSALGFGTIALFAIAAAIIAAAMSNPVKGTTGRYKDAEGNISDIDTTKRDPRFGPVV
jgi:hypothetical protein